LWVFVVLLVAGLGVVFYFFDPVTTVKENLAEAEYDKIYHQKPVMTQQGVDSVLNGLQKLTFNQLDTAYLNYTGYAKPKFKVFVQNRTFYVIKGRDIFKYLVGKHRIKDFLAKDKYYNYNLNHLDKNGWQYFLIDKQVLYKLLFLKQTLRKRGYDENAFWIGFGQRHPQLNKEVGGASVSFHIQGKAIDINILDIDKDGVPTKADKKIVMDMLENEIIGKYGGVGRYPWSMTIHFDVRGYYARWDHQ
jgi:uncharacterized protein YcbK (DUF882 family)